MGFAPARGFRRRIGLAVSVGLVSSLLVVLGCRSRTPPPAEPVVEAPQPKATPKAKSAPTITANPNPVPAGPEKFGKTTVNWDTGDGSIGEVYVSANGAPERLFAGNRAKGSLEAAWIGKGEYEFRLYAGKEHKVVLASVKVTRNKQ